jgi:two-component system, cell cycle response regulator
VIGRPSARVATRRRIAANAETRAFAGWLATGAAWIIRRAAAFVLAYAALALAAVGVFRDPAEGSTRQLLVLAGLCVVMVVRLFERLQRSAIDAKIAPWADLELGTLFVAAAFVLIEMTGGPAGLLYPLVFALVAFLVAYHRLAHSLYFVTLILVTEAAIMWLDPAPADMRLFLSHASFILLFAFLYAMFLRVEVLQRDRRLEHEIDGRLEQIASEAREFRLTSGLSFESRNLTAEQLRTRRRIGSIQAIHESLYNVLAVAERALSPHTVALLWMDSDDRRLRVKELRSHSDNVSEQPIGAGEGVLGAVVKRKEPLVLSGLKPGYSGLVYYRKPEPVTDFAGVPVVEGEHLRGVLVADRRDGVAFGSADLDVMNTLAGEIVRAVQVERIFSEMDSEKFQRERFYQASRDFNSALTIDEVAQVAIGACLRVTQAELAAVAVALEQEGMMQVAAVSTGNYAKLVGHTFAAESGLIGAAIKARHPLPVGTARAATQHIFDEKAPIACEYIKVLPLVLKDTGVGALVLGSSREDFLPLELVDMLKVIADHAAIAIANAQMYARMERMATTDGLTGVFNHRHFQGLFDDYIARAERYGRKLSVILADIDHFKSINDTYGHPVGDVVLKKVARLMHGKARKTDVVARYGGEEFAILMEETDRAGALQMAERVREAVAGEEMRCEQGKFKCTLSLGIATYPDDGMQKAKITECADQSLYEAKRSGRNRSVTYAQLTGR